MKMRFLNEVVFIYCFFFSSSQIKCLLNIETLEFPLINYNVTTTIDISSQIVIKTHELSLKNSGNVSTSSFLIAIEPNLEGKLANIEVLDEDQNILTVKPDMNIQHQTFYTISLNKPLESKKTRAFTVKTIYSNLLVSLPKEVMQNDSHFVQFTGNILFYSPYFTLNHSTFINKGQGRIESIEGSYINIFGRSIIECEHFPSVPSFSKYPIYIHYENLRPFLTITNLKRDIYLSQWGFIDVNEEIDIMHSGAKFVGPFHRVHASSNDRQISQFELKLPLTAYNIYLSDEIGIIWSFDVNKLEDHIQLLIRSRFLLFGGWKTNFVLHYTVPANHYLYRNGSHYIFEMNVFETYKNTVAEEVLINVILPGGAEFLNFDPSYDKQLIYYNNNFFSVLDRIGHTIIGIKKTNLVQTPVKPIIVEFNFTNEALFKFVAHKIGILTMIICTTLITIKHGRSILKAFD